MRIRVTMSTDTALKHTRKDLRNMIAEVRHEINKITELVARSEQFELAGTTGRNERTVMQTVAEQYTLAEQNKICLELVHGYIVNIERRMIALEDETLEPIRSAIYEQRSHDQLHGDDIGGRSQAHPSHQLQALDETTGVTILRPIGAVYYHSTAQH